MAAMAAALVMALRTLHRHLAEEHTKFRLLVGEAPAATVAGVYPSRSSMRALTALGPRTRGWGWPQSLAAIEPATH